MFNPRIQQKLTEGDMENGGGAKPRNLLALAMRDSQEIRILDSKFEIQGDSLWFEDGTALC